jgi:hypothetical protein
MGGKHSFDKKILEKHHRTSNTEGGACLNRHIPDVTRSSCSHRWQARERAADEDAEWYNWDAYRELVGPGHFKIDIRPVPKKKSGILVFFPMGYTESFDVVNGRLVYLKKKPQERDWDVEGDNFMTYCTVPYWHQAHHIIPNSKLNGCILDVSKNSKSFRLYKLIRIGLLDAKYNINHKTNMIILPMDKEVSIALKLPRHLRAGSRSHKHYSAKIEKKVKRVIRRYAKVAKKNVEDHDAPPVKLSKKNLEQISEKMRNLIRKWGELESGKTLTRMTKKFLREHYT